jgi:hypothetical protein
MPSRDMHPSTSIPADVTDEFMEEAKLVILASYGNPDGLDCDELRVQRFIAGM